MGQPELTREIVTDLLMWIREGVTASTKEARLGSLASGLTKQQREKRIESYANRVAAADFIKHCCSGIEAVLPWLPEVLLEASTDDEAQVPRAGS